MSGAIIRFYGELNDFLPERLRQRPLTAAFEGPASVKAVVEACGVPHTEIDLVLADGSPAGLADRAENGGRLAVYPRFRALEPSAEHRLLPSPHLEPRFILDVHLGRLAGYLRLAGIDADYAHDRPDEELARLSQQEDRTLLTRDRELLKRSAVVRGRWIRSTEPRRQLAEVVRRFDLESHLRPFTRCARCNRLLEPVPKADVIALLPPRVALAVDAYVGCPGCGRIYWEGTHVERIRTFLRLALEEAPPS